VWKIGTDIYTSGSVTQAELDKIIELLKQDGFTPESPVQINPVTNAYLLNEEAHGDAQRPHELRMALEAKKKDSK
jgi:hypothetical protein